MATRRTFFSFKYKDDVSRAMVVRNSWVTQGKEAAGFVDAVEFERIRRGGDPAIKKWIDGQLNGTSVTVVLVGRNTCTSRWVKYEIAKSKEIGNGLLGIDISYINDLQGNRSKKCGKIPAGYNFYGWYAGKGYDNMGDWIDKAARDVGR